MPVNGYVDRDNIAGVGFTDPIHTLPAAGTGDVLITLVQAGRL